jgi:glucose/arabinose dehydrogenase
MKHYRAVWVVPLVLTLALLPFATSTLAQEATPSGQASATSTPASSPTQGPIMTLAPAAYFPGGQGTTASPGGTLPGNPQIQLVKVAGGLLDPINVASPNDGSGRLFIIERQGTIRIIDKDGNLLDEPFLDIRSEVLSQFLEDGLLDMNFDPNYKDNGYFYLNYTSLLYNGDVFLMRYKVSADDPNKADPNSGEVVMFRDQQYANHVGGGALVFGPDGYLYVSVGDGGLEGDPLETGQYINDLYGSILRIDVHNTPDGKAGYTIPADNPFADSGARPVNLFALTEEDFAQFHTEARPEIWLWGLRNPWQFSFDSQTGDMYISDVGQNKYEEVDFLPAGQTGGQNLGWDIMEASHCMPVSIDYCAKVGLLPVAEYSHDVGCTVIGSDVYRGSEFADLDGIYFAGDFCSGRVWGIERDDSGQWQMQQLLDTKLFMTGSGTDENGDIYLTNCVCGYGTTSQPDGSVWRIVSASNVPQGAETAQIDTPTPAAGATGTPASS